MEYCMKTYSKFNETPQKFQVKTELNIRKRPGNKLADSSKATRHRPYYGYADAIFKRKR